MTGKDLIIYILSNNLEDEPVFIDKGFMNLISETKAANKFGVGLTTIKIWYELGMIEGVRVGDEIYILPNSEPKVI